MKDLGTNREQKVIVHPSSGLSREEIERMKKEAERFSAEDARKRELVEARNQADSAIYSAEKLLREQRDKVPSHLKSEIEAKMNSLRQVMSGDDASAIRRSIQSLSELLQRVGMEVYRRTPPGQEKKPPEGGTVEGEYKNPGWFTSL